MDSCNHLQEVNKTTSGKDNYKDQNPQLCANGCGFFGTKAYNNFCSKCFKDHILQKEEKDEKPNKNPFPCFNNSSNKGEKYNKNPFPCFNKSNNKDDSLTRNEDAADDEKTNGKVMCTYCDKKIRGLMIYKCRCNGRFCIKHRCPEEHSCKFDFKNHGRLALAKQNPVVKGEKLDQRI
ncbi:hypothetical protein Leryth_017412 [Lithospermum erythrorhizon]|nr:hypothetical protein Leryth_017412 [Lithospermum erythrorhizon]